MLYFGASQLLHRVDILLVTYLRPNTKTITNKSTDNADEIKCAVRNSVYTLTPPTSGRVMVQETATGIQLIRKGRLL